MDGTEDDIMYKKETGNRYWIIYTWLNPVAKFAGYDLKNAKRLAKEVNQSHNNIEVKIVKEIGAIYG